MWQQDHEQNKKTNPEVSKYFNHAEDRSLTNFSASSSNFYGLPKSNKSALISEATAKQNNEYVEVLEPSDLKLQPTVAGPTFPTRPLTFSWRRPLSYRNQSIDLLCKSMDCFLYDNGLRHERVKWSFR